MTPAPPPPDLSELTRDELRRLAAWVVETCLLFGASLETAYIVAGHFIQGLQAESQP